MKTLLTIFVLFFSSNVFSNDVNLKCVISQYMDVSTGKIEDAVPEEFTVIQEGNLVDGYTYLRFFPDICQQYITYIDENTISGSCSREISTGKLKQEFTIDRYNGVMRNSFIFKGELKSVTISKCKKADKLF